jgi:hypothetical protein
MFNRKKKLSLWGRIKAFFVSIYWKFRGEALHVQLQDHSSPLRSDAERAVNRIVYETRVAPDCVSAMIFRGAPSITVKHDKLFDGSTSTITNGLTYAEAADRTIAWIEAQGLELTYTGVTKISNTATHMFDNKRKKMAKDVRRSKKKQNHRRH